MTDAPEVKPAPLPEDGLPEPVAVRRHRWTVSLVWIVPLLAALVGLSLMVNAWLSEGPEIVISFQDAQGITAGKTEVKYKNVVIGKVRHIELGSNRSRVLVTVGLDQKAAGFATQGSRYWVVRPRIGLGGVSGLGTLLSGSYIGADTGGSDKRQTQFTGLETPPPLTHYESGRSFLLTSNDLGSLDIGSPVYYRRIQVGRVVAYHLDADGKGVTVQVFITAPDDAFVTTNTRFWNASGVDIAVNAGGLTVNTESLATVLAGGIAFLTPPDGKAAPAAAGAHFTLFANRAAALSPPDGPPLALQMRFHQSVRGLAVGAPVDFLGINIGTVTAVSLDYDPAARRFPADVSAVVYPERIGSANARFSQRTGDAAPGALLALLVRHGLHAQLRNGNLLTGQLYVALDFFPGAPKVAIDASQRPLVVPTIAGSFDRMQQQLADIVARMHKVPFDQIGVNLNASLAQLDVLLKQFHEQLAPQATAALKQAQQTLDAARHVLSSGSPLQQNLDQTLQQLQRAARSLRVLTDYLSQHPESLLRGRRDDGPPPLPAPASSTPARPPRSQP